MTFNAHSAIAWTWEALGLLWLASFAFTKPTLRAQHLGARVFNIALGALAFAMVGLSWFDRGWLAVRFVPGSNAFALAGFLLTLAGALFAAWARLTLGANWSGRPSVKAGHELVIKGPYALVRHPIYTGLLLAVAGTALDVDKWRAVLGFALLIVVFALKMGNEEGLMMQTFPDAYPNYRKRVKALVPGLL